MWLGSSSLNSFPSVHSHVCCEAAKRKRKIKSAQIEVNIHGNIWIKYVNANLSICTRYSLYHDRVHVP